jgi:hypothetical protein
MYSLWKVMEAMARPTRLVLLLGTLVGFALGLPTTSQAGLIPWVYNAIFGPVGSMRYGAGYAPAYGGYGGYGGYGAMYGSYAPTTAYGYGGGGCSSCRQSSYYAPSMGYDVYSSGYAYDSYPVASTAGCSTCQTGNCAPGSTCSNCTVNSAPASSNYGSTTSGSGTVPAPVPDPNNTRDVNSRLNEDEHRLNIDEHRLNELEKFLRRQYPEYKPETYRNPANSTYETVPPRKNLTIDSSDPANPENYKLPRQRNNNAAPPIDPLEEERRKMIIPIPAPIDDKSNEKDGTDSKGSTTFRETEPQTLRLYDRSTSQAVAPRERMKIVTKQSKTAIVKSNKTETKTSDNVRLPELARN